METSPTIPPLGTKPEDFIIVGIGASAGGIKALVELLRDVPPHTGMAYVVLAHVSPEDESCMPGVLQQATVMPVAAVTERVRIEPDRVYVISSRSQLRMQDDYVEPSEGSRGGTTTIDRFFTTLANVHKQRCVAIVLSGSGSDGTLGALSVKAQGGITVAQPPEEAQYGAMPRNAIASGAIDFVIPVSQIPASLKHLVELHGGALEVVPEGKQKPAQFTARLPLQWPTSSTRLVAATEPPAVAPQRLNGVRVLVIDDEAANADALRDLLQLEGASAVAVNSGREAVEIARQHGFDAIICDVRMPDMDGHEVAKRLASGERNAKTPLIAYTGFSGPDDRRRAAVAGFAVHLAKPVTLDRLVEAIQSARKAASAA